MNQILVNYHIDIYFYFSFAVNVAVSVRFLFKQHPTSRGQCYLLETYSKTMFYSSNTLRNERNTSRDYQRQKISNTQFLFSIKLNQFKAIVKVNVKDIF